MGGGSGTLTFVFTDLVDSTQLWERYPDAMPGALERHDAILHAAVAAASGRILKTTDGVMAVFTAPGEAVRACLDTQQALEGGGPAGPRRALRGARARPAGTAAHGRPRRSARRAGGRARQPARRVALLGGRRRP